MKYVVSNYFNDLSWIRDYTDDYIIYDQSGTSTLPNTISVSHGGTDIKDKLSYIISYYDNLPDVFALIKGNLFKFITKEEFDLIKDNRTFTPLLTQGHKTNMPVSFYKDGMYNEINNYWYIYSYPSDMGNIDKLKKLLGTDKYEYMTFAPGSNYIVTKDNVLQHPKSFYKELIGYLGGEYPGEAQLIERNLYNIFKC